MPPRPQTYANAKTRLTAWLKASPWSAAALKPLLGSSSDCCDDSSNSKQRSGAQNSGTT